MIFKYAILIFYLIFKTALGDISQPVVELPLGKLEGHFKETWKGREFFAFEGVPYAKPPTGDLRFEEPQPVEPWQGTWIARTVYKCIQWNHFALGALDRTAGEEDCLYVNVYTPDLHPKEPLEVIVSIHGGAFMFNDGSFQGPELVLEKNVVFVNFNYRLGPFGFLSTEDNVVPGNMGLKDQTLALKWIQKYIKYFGGNPQSVTIIGLSAGGASVNLHYLMPASRGLFHRGISLSGSAMCSWVLVENSLEKARKVASEIGCNQESTEEMVNCMKKKPARQIVQTVSKFQPFIYNPYSPFGVVVDTWATNPSLPDHPYSLITKKQVMEVPWIASWTQAEGLYPAADFYSEKYINEIETHWNELMPHILDYNYTVDPSLRDSVSQKIRKHYLNNRPLSKGTFTDFVKIISDRLFIIDIVKTARLTAAAMDSPVYSYYFSYRGANSFSDLISGTKDNLGVSHGDDASYLLKTPLDTTSTENDRKMVQLFVNLLENYAKTSKPKVPNTEWPPLAKQPDGKYTYLHISQNDLKTETVDEVYDKEFWDSLPIIENEKLIFSATNKDEL